MGVYDTDQFESLQPSPPLQVTVATPIEMFFDRINNEYVARAPRAGISIRRGDPDAARGALEERVKGRLEQSSFVVAEPAEAKLGGDR